ncbi:MAG: hypothetical protein LBG11_01495 [Bifidobacteriaceae bacterium]|nr:hypothetical protein [Bifidobacteriaceae bacterium]
MASDDLAKLVAGAVAPISPLLFQDVSDALTNAEQRVGDLVRSGAVHLRALTMREELRAMLADQDLQGWAVGGNPGKMGELYLKHPETGILLRVLKERRKTYPGGIPVAGANRARRAYWSRANAPQWIQGALTGHGMPPAEPLGLLLVWDLVSARDLEQGFTLRVVRTAEPGDFGSRVRLDLSVELDATASAWTHLQFLGDDEMEDFFPDEETGTGQQGAM